MFNRESVEKQLSGFYGVDVAFCDFCVCADYNNSKIVILHNSSINNKFI